MQTAIILGITAAMGLLLLNPVLGRVQLWMATVTPLASIIGSGFLVLGPVLNVAYGQWAPVVMVGLCLVAWLFGDAIRYNITALEPAAGARSLWEERCETAASWALAFAYAISVAYYLNLFGAFGVSLTPVRGALAAKLLTSAMLLLVLAVGWTRGFSALEGLERITVGLKLAVIAGLLWGLATHFSARLADGAVHFEPPLLTGWSAVATAFGLVVMVQGFETSRYLGASYDAPMRIRSMRAAQGLSAAIYVAYAVLIAYGFDRQHGAISETAIIDMMAQVAPVLPFLLVAGALSAQFSAAVADTGGSGGLVEELSRGLVPARGGYALLAGIGLWLTWLADVFEIIAYASRAFAVYYALQSVIAAAAAWRFGARRRAAWYGALSGLGWVIAVFGVPAG